MTPQLFREVCDGLCTLIDAPCLTLHEDFHGTLSFHLDRLGVIINVLYLGQAYPDQACLLFELGVIASDDSHALRIALALLDVNFLLPQRHPVTLCRNPLTGHVMLRYIHPLQTSAAELLEVVDHGVALAIQWRETSFLKTYTAEPNTGLPLLSPTGVFA